jgi:hypothetical protein
MVVHMTLTVFVDNVRQEGGSGKSYTIGMMEVAIKKNYI